VLGRTGGNQKFKQKKLEKKTVSRQEPGTAGVNQLRKKKKPPKKNQMGQGNLGAAGGESAKPDVKRPEAGWAV